MKIDKIHFDIAALVGKLLVMGLNTKEQEELDAWLNLSERNRLWFDRVTSTQYKSRKRKDFYAVDVHRGWEMLQYKRGKKAKVVFWMKSWMKYAAIILTPLLLAAGIWLWQQHTGTKMLTETIKPGSYRATLVLSDGKAVELNEVGEKQLKEKFGSTIDLGINHVGYESKVSEPDSLIYNTLVVPRGGEYSTTLGDGTEVYLNADSRLRFPVSFAGDRREVELQGEAYFKVAHNTQAPFIVKAMGMEVQVLGTEFNISAYPGDAAVQTTLVKGSVRAGISEAAEAMVLMPGQQAELLKATQTMHVKEVDISIATAWKDGRLRFKEKPLGEIMETLSRWYDVDVVFTDDSLKNYGFGCNISRYSNIEPVLKIFEATGTIQIRLTDNNTLMITNKNN